MQNCYFDKKCEGEILDRMRASDGENNIVKKHFPEEEMLEF